MKRIVILVINLVLLFLPLLPEAQVPPKPDAAEILKKIKKLKVLGNVLYVAAHPDDENTRLIAYLSRHELVNTAYFSFTRGDGGQNLIGPEIREKLGLIRTRELLAARRIDEGLQFFSRAVDFGYSKHPDETFEVWDREKVLGDLVWVIRNFKPDIIITRFNDEPGRSHGHHTASAILAREAFHLAGDPDSYPEQLEHAGVWQPKSLYWNTSWWFYGTRDFDDSGMIKVNVGEYDPLLGLSYTELAAGSRSMHKSQGFGASGSRGDEIEYLEQWEGEKVKADIFENLNTSWTGIEGGEVIESTIDKMLLAYDPLSPGNTVDDLIKLRNQVEALHDDFWRKKKLQEIDELIYYCAGLFLEVKSEYFSAAPGTELRIDVEAINRSENEIVFHDFTIGRNIRDTTLDYSLAHNHSFTFATQFQIPDNTEISQPYWLKHKPEKGMFVVKDQALIGKPENEPAIQCRFDLLINGKMISYTRPAIFKQNDPVEGEVYRPFVIIDPVHINFENDISIFPDRSAKIFNVIVKAGKDNVGGRLHLSVNDSWQINPDYVDFSLSGKNEEKIFVFEVTPPEGQSVDRLKASAEINGVSYNRGYEEIDYDHIPLQTLFPEASVKLVKPDIQKRGDRIGYIEGAGDEIPESLEQIGYKVEYISEDDFTNNRLDRFDAIITGIRAYNTVQDLKFKQPKLMQYVRDGGTMIVQYNTSHRLVTEDLAPYPLQLSRDRVTVEEAPVTILAEDHPVMKHPNKITEEDFDGWVQERGLYFPDEWDERYTPVLSCHDPGEDPKKGGLLVTRYGKGYYIYTGYSWFRELPAGVPGAFRIFANLVSLGN